MNHYPTELTVPPIPVVALIYLQELHPAITKSLSSETTGAIRVLSFSNETSCFEKKKPKRDFTNYKPKGIIKRGWMKKTQEQNPAVALVLVEWKIKEDWKKQEAFIIGTFEKVKVAAQGRNTKFILLIVTEEEPPGGISYSQQETSQPKEENQKVDEFLGNLKRVCQIDGKCIVVIKKSSIETGFNQKSGKIVTDLCTAYYKEMATKIRKYKSEVNKQKQPELYIRHRFKVAYYFEILRSNSKALKYLSQAYAVLPDVSTKEYSPEEIRTVGDYINFKICVLRLAEKKIASAVKQFMTHIAWYKKQIGDEELRYEHCAYIYRQYRTFGELLESVPKSLLSSQQRYQNPGYYFEAAASAARLRKKYAKKLCEPYRLLAEAVYKDDDKSLTEDDELTSKTGYIGQQNFPPPKEPTHPKYLREIAKELRVNHSEEILAMLKKAYDQYVKRNLKRMIYYLAYCMGEEYYECQQWENARKFFEKIAKYYRKEKWYKPLTLILKQLLRCCDALNLSREYIAYTLELVSDKMDTTDEERIQYIQSLLMYLKKPKECGLKLSPLNAPVVFDVDNSHILFNLKVHFATPYVCVFDRTEFRLQFTSHAPEPIRFSKLQVQFKNHPEYDFSISDGEDLSKFDEAIKEALKRGAKGMPLDKPKQQAGKSKQPVSPKPFQMIVAPNKPTVFSFPMIIKERMDLECKSVSVQLGEPPMAVIFKWTMADNRAYISQLNNYDYRYEVGQGLFVDRPVIRVTQPEPKISISYEHASPSLVNEYYVLNSEIIINSHSDHVVNGRIAFVPAEGIKIFGHDLEQIAEVSFNEIVPESSHTLSVFLKCSKPGVKQVRLRVKYATRFYDPLHYESTFDMWTIYPFNSIFKFIGTRSTQACLNGKHQTFHLVPNQEKTFVQKITEKECLNIELKDERKTISDTQRTPIAQTVTPPPPPQRQYKKLEGFPAKEPIVFTSRFTCVTPFPLYIKKISLKHDTKFFKCLSPAEIVIKNNAILTDQEDKPTATKTVLESSDVYTVSHIIQATRHGNKSLGYIELVCERAEPLTIDNLTDSVKDVIKDIIILLPLPVIHVFPGSLAVMFDYPSQGTLGSAMDVSLSIENRSYLVQSITLSTSDSEAFFFAGTTNITCSILPYSTRVFKYSMVPVLTGHVTFPKFTISTARENSYVLNENEQWSVFVKPITRLETTVN